VKKFFIHNPLFIVLCPLFNGIIIYLLILLINNDIANLIDHFLDQELLLCIGLAFVTQEMTRQIFLVFERKNYGWTSLKMTIIQLSVTVLSVSINIGLLVAAFFKLYVGFSASSFELLLFIGIYVFLSIFFLSLLYSYNYLTKKNTRKLQKIHALKEDLKRDFNQFKEGINPGLLFKSLEALLVMVKEDNPQSDEIIDQLAIVYRYVLSKRSQELVPLKEEVNIASQLVNLFSHLPFTKVNLNTTEDIDSLIIPGTILKTIEMIVQNSIPSKSIKAEITIKENSESIILEFQTLEKLTQQFSQSDLTQINSSYKYFSDRLVEFINGNSVKRILIPKLQATKI